MPKRKVVQTIIVYREGARIKPAIGEIFDFRQDELDSINKINPEAVTRPLIEVDVENEAAQAAAAEKAKAEEEAAAKASAKAAASSKAKASTASNKEEEV